MYFSTQILTLFFVSCGLVLGIPSGLEVPKEKRIVCNSDNVLRALKRIPSDATSLCYSLILYGVPTTTVVPPAGVTPAPV